MRKGAQKRCFACQTGEEQTGPDLKPDLLVTLVIIISVIIAWLVLSPSPSPTKKFKQLLTVQSVHLRQQVPPAKTPNK